MIVVMMESLKYFRLLNEAFIFFFIYYCKYSDFNKVLILFLNELFDYKAFDKIKLLNVCIII